MAQKVSPQVIWFCTHRTVAQCYSFLSLPISERILQLSVQFPGVSFVDFRRFPWFGKPLWKKTSALRLCSESLLWRKVCGKQTNSQLKEKKPSYKAVKFNWTERSMSRGNRFYICGINLKQRKLSLREIHARRKLKHFALMKDCLK